jgi:threonine dehydrogenase-like Zn-dependent dehydrogenase
VIEDAANVLPIPDDLTFDEASFFALASIALNGVRKSTIELGESVAVMGQGLVGQLALQLARLSGAVPLIAIDMLNTRLETSMKSGADLVINPVDKDPNAEIGRLTGGKGVNVVIEATGNPDAIPAACKLTKPFGRIILLGSPRGETTINFYSEVHAKSVTMIGSYMRPKYESYHGSWTDKEDAKLILRLLDQGRLKVGHLVTKKIPYYEAVDAYQQVIDKTTLGIILDWQL